MIDRNDSVHGDEHIEMTERDEKETISDLTIEDIMAQECQVSLGRNKDHGWVLEIETDNGDIIREQMIASAAIESLADFCQQVLNQYKHINN